MRQLTFFQGFIQNILILKNHKLQNNFFLCMSFIPYSILFHTKNLNLLKTYKKLKMR